MKLNECQLCASAKIILSLAKSTKLGASKWMCELYFYDAVSHKTILSIIFSTRSTPDAQYTTSASFSPLFILVARQMCLWHKQHTFFPSLFGIPQWLCVMSFMRNARDTHWLGKVGYFTAKQCNCRP